MTTARYLLAILNDTDALSTLLDPAVLPSQWTAEQCRTALAAGEKAGRVEIVMRHSDPEAAS